MGSFATATEKSWERSSVARLDCFAFEAIAKGTPCEGVKLDIEHKPIRGQCKKCDQSFEVELRNPIAHPGCSKCGSDDFELLPDGPLILEEIELQTD